MFYKRSIIKKLEYLAYHDSLTNLLNRNWLYKNIDNIKQSYVYFIDINDLHSINKKGHMFGDDHIIFVVKSIKIDKDEILIRYAGDEFILFTNKKNKLHCNKLYSVGVSVINGSIKNAINNADENMIINKKNQR